MRHTVSSQAKKNKKFKPMKDLIDVDEILVDDDFVAADKLLTNDLSSIEVENPKKFPDRDLWEWYYCHYIHCRYRLRQNAARK